MARQSENNSALSILRVVSIVSFVAGIFWRAYFVFISHPAYRFIESDMAGYVDRARRFCSGTESSILDTLHPPITHFFFGLLYCLDRSWSLALVGQFLVSVSVPPVTALLALQLYRPSVSYIALILSSLNFLFIDYAGYFLSENLMILFVPAVVLGFVGLHRLSGKAVGAFAALAVGCFVGIAVGTKALALFAFVPLIFPVAFSTMRKITTSFRLITLTAFFCGLIIVIAPLSLRCSQIAGRFCLVDTKSSVHVLLGKYGFIRGANWRDPIHGDTWWAMPTALELGRQEMVDITHPFFDQVANMKMVWEAVRQRPFATLVLSLDQVAALFTAGAPWPSGQTNQRIFVLFAELIVRVTVLLPAAAWVLSFMPQWFDRRERSFAEIALVWPYIGLCLAAFISVGEVRYRIPFDTLGIILAARYYAYLFGLRYERNAFERDRPLFADRPHGTSSATSALAVGTASPSCGKNCP